MSEEQNESRAEEEYALLIKEAVRRFEAQELEQATEYAGAAMTKCSDNAEALVIMGAIAYLADDLGRAVQLLGSAHELSPDMLEAADMLGQIQTEVGNLTEGVYYSKIATIADPSPLLADFKVPGIDGLAEAIDKSDTKTYLNEARVALSRGLYEEALDLCDKELRLQGGTVEIFRVLANARLGLHDPERALNGLLAAVHLDPDDAEIHRLLGKTHGILGDRDRALAALAKARECAGDNMRELVKIAATATDIDPEHRVVTNPLHLTQDSREVFREKLMHVENDVRIGILTDAAANIEEMRVLESLLVGMDRNSVDVYVFSADLPDDPIASRLKGYATAWHSVRDFDDETVADWIGVNHLSALIDLTFNDETQRPSVLISKSTRFNVGLFGPKSTAFGDVYDKILTNSEDGPFAGKSLFVDAPILAVDPSTMPKVGTEVPAAENGYVTFGANADLRYLTPDVARVFADVVRRVPDSRLLFDNVHPLSDGMKETILGYFADNGVVDKIDFYEHSSGGDANLVMRRLQQMVRIDVYLETFPRASLFPSLDALWTGVPVVVMEGHAFAGSASSGMLRHAGLDDMVANTEARYLAMAVERAIEVAELKDRSGIIKDFRARSMFDAPANARAIGKAIGDL